jgi:hypothetical protein
LKRDHPALNSSLRCPLHADVCRIANLGNDLAVALHRLKRRIKTCQRACQGFPAKSATTQTDPPSPLCDQLVNFNTQVQAAVSAVLEEWDTGAQNGRD